MHAGWSPERNWTLLLQAGVYIPQRWPWKHFFLSEVRRRKMFFAWKFSIDFNRVGVPLEFPNTSGESPGDHSPWIYMESLSLCFLWNEFFLCFSTWFWESPRRLLALKGHWTQLFFSLLSEEEGYFPSVHVEVCLDFCPLIGGAVIAPFDLYRRQWPGSLISMTQP